MSTTYQFADLVIGALNFDISNSTSAFSINLTSGVLPVQVNGGRLLLMIGIGDRRVPTAYELIEVTAWTAGSLTAVARGTGGTTALPWAAISAWVEMRVAAPMLRSFVQDRWRFDNPEWGMALDGSDDNAGVTLLMAAATATVRNRPWRAQFRNINVRCVISGYYPALSGTANPVDGVTLNVGDRVLDRQGTAGNAPCKIWVVASGAWTQATDFTTWEHLTANGTKISTIVLVAEGIFYEQTELMFSWASLGTGTYTGTPALNMNYVNSIKDEVRVTLPEGKSCYTTDTVHVTAGVALDVRGELRTNPGAGITYGRKTFGVRVHSTGRLERLNQIAQSGSGCEIAGISSAEHGDVYVERPAITSDTTYVGLSLQGFGYSMKRRFVANFGTNLHDESADVIATATYLLNGFRQIEILGPGGNNQYGAVTLDNTQNGGDAIRVNGGNRLILNAEVFSLEGYTAVYNVLRVGDIGATTDPEYIYAVMQSSGMDITLNVQNTGGTVCKLRNITESTIRVNTSRNRYRYALGWLGSGTAPIQTLVEWQDDCTATVSIEANLSTSVTPVAFASGITTGGVVRYTQGGAQKVALPNGTIKTPVAAAPTTAPANATDLATALTLVNDLKARIAAMGGAA